MQHDRILGSHPDALPLFKSFLKPVSLKQRARQLVLRCVIAFLMHLGKMSASRVAGAVRTDARHRAQVSRFLGRRYWRRCDLLGQLRAQLLEMEARQGTFVFDIDQTYCSQQGKLTENTIIRGEKTKRPKKSKKKQKKYAQRSSHCFVMGLLITPSGMRLPFSVSYYTEAYCKAKKIAHRKQTELAAQLIRQLPLPPEGAWWSWETPPSTPRPSALPARNASLVGSCPSTPSGFLLERSHVPKSRRCLRI